MRQVYSFQFHKPTNPDMYKFLYENCIFSGKLYNQALDLLLKGIETKEYENICTLDTKLKNLHSPENFYRKLKAQVAQQIIRMSQKACQTFFKSLSVYNKNPKKCTGRPNLPKQVSIYHLIYTSQCSSIKNGYIFLDKTHKIFIPQYNVYKERLKNFKQIRILPRRYYFKIEIVYDIQGANENVDISKYASIDFGLNNLCTLFLENECPELITGRDIKSINHFYHKQKAKIQTIRNGKPLFQKQLEKLYTYRENHINDKFHKVSRYIVRRLLELGIGTLVIGYNKGWKDSINIGKKNNQKFCSIPHWKLLQMILYKCSLVGIMVITHEESYTSKCDSLAFESIEKHDSYTGVRMKRGLFQSSIGVLINADVNGALNILRKCKGDEEFKRILPACKGFLFNSIKIRVC